MLPTGAIRRRISQLWLVCSRVELKVVMLLVDTVGRPMTLGRLSVRIGLEGFAPRVQFPLSKSHGRPNLVAIVLSATLLHFRRGLFL